MATQIQTMPAPSLALPNQSSGGSIITQIFRVFIHPKTFFRQMPAGSQWLAVVFLVLVITGFTATAQIQSTSASSTATTSSTQSSSFNINSLSATSTTGSPTTAANTALTGTAATGTSSTSSVSSDSTLMTGLLAVCGVLVMWAGQTTALSLITMLRGYAPQVGKSLQIAVWASLPLALMLVLRYAHFASGGSGGSLGVSLLITNWNGFSQLPTVVQRILEVFTSNFTLFWLWNLLLIYLGARFALGGRRISVALVVALWITAATIVPAFVSTPQTRITARPTTTSSQTTTSTNRSNSSTTTGTSTTTTQSQQGGFPSGGQPPSGGFPGGGPGG